MTAEEKLKDMLKQEKESECFIGVHIRPKDIDLIANLVIERMNNGKN